MSDSPLSGKVALITGGNKGLGKAMAQALAAAGARLALVSRDLPLLQSVAAELQSSGAEAEAFQADVTQEADVQRLHRQVGDRFGGVHILINNAGINLRKPITDFTLEEWQRVMNTNLTGPFLMCRAFVPVLKAQGYGRIINMTSIMSHVALAERTAYASSKFGLLGLTKALALELIKDNITVNGISPGPFATEMNQPIIQNPELNAQFLAKIPMGRWGDVAEVGRLAVFLSSPEAGFITGTDILIDGGWTAQ
jgi:NAD(P)-dependent dehydrogenase (short-subunit alcohol dehydrogenase family)